MKRFTSRSTPISQTYNPYPGADPRERPIFRRRSSVVATSLALAVLGMGPQAARAVTLANPLCPAEKALYNPGNGEDIAVPAGYTVSVFASGLNFPTGIAFRARDGSGKKGFEVYVLESGHGLPAGNSCNDEATFQQTFPGQFNPFTPDIKVFNSNGQLLRTLAKPTDATTTTGGVNVLQPHGPAVDIAFEYGIQGGRLFATDSNQSIRGTGNNNSSRIVTVDPMTGAVTPFITNLPTGDHPTEQLAFQDGWMYWSQGSTTNSGVVGRDNGGGANQPDIPCQDIVLSKNVFDSGGGIRTSGYSPFGTQRPGATVMAFEGAMNGMHVCDGAILRVPLNAGNPAAAIQPYSWGYRNGYAIRFAPKNHVLKGGLLVGEDGPDERGARPSNSATDNLHLARQNDDGTPDYHGWPDRFGFLATSQRAFNPVGGPADDLCVADATNPPSKCTLASLAQILAEDVPIRDVLDHPPQAITAPLAVEAADSSFTGIDFVPDSFVHGPVQRGAAMYTLEGDLGFSAANSATNEVGHELKLINFLDSDDKSVALSITRFAKNKSNEPAFTSGERGWNRPTIVRFGPDGCAWVVDWGVVRDPGQSGADSAVANPADGPLPQIPGTGAVFRICRQ
jgi:hypothetical protein